MCGKRGGCLAGSTCHLRFPSTASSSWDTTRQPHGQHQQLQETTTGDWGETLISFKERTQEQNCDTD